MGNVVSVENPIDSLPVVWQTSLVTDVALGVDDDIICEAYGLQYTQLLKIKQDPSFRKRLKALEEELQKEGVSFRLKAQMQADELLKTSFAMIHDEDIDPKVRAKLIEDTVRWAGYDNVRGDSGGDRASFVINIDLGKAEKEVNDAQIYSGNEFISAEGSDGED